MSETESKFLRTLTIRLVSILTPFFLALIGSAITDHFQIKNNREHVDLLEQTQKSYATNDMLLIYYDQLREANKLLKEEMDKEQSQNDQRFKEVNADMDALIRDVYKLTRRGNENKLENN